MSDPILGSDGSPFKTLTAAKMVFTKRKLDAEKYVIEELSEDEGKGFRIIEAPEKIAEPVVIDSKGNIEMGEFPIIRIGPPGRGESKKVDLGLNGVLYRVTRGRNVCLPKSFVKVLDTAVERVYPELEEGEDAKPYDRQRFPYTFIRNGTRSDFVKMFENGDSID